MKQNEMSEKKRTFLTLELLEIAFSKRIQIAIMDTIAIKKKCRKLSKNYINSALKGRFIYVRKEKRSVSTIFRYDRNNW